MIKLYFNSILYFFAYTFITRRSSKAITIILCFGFATVAKCTIFKCNYISLNWEFIGDNVYACQAEIIHQGSVETLEAVEGDHQPDKSNFDVGYLSISDQVLNEIPSDVAEFFPNLKSVKFTSTNLMRVSSRNLKQFPNIIVFSASRNKLESLDGDLFKFTPKLQWISFSYNLIKSVGLELLANVPDLEFVDFRDNPCLNVLAEGPQMIEKLKLQLLGCPPISFISHKALSSNSTDDECLTRVIELETEVAKLSNNITDQSEIIATYELKFVTLQNQITQIIANISHHNDEDD